MYEKKHQPVLSNKEFFIRLLKHIGIAVLILAFGLGSGILGYHYTEKMPWIDAFVNAAMILSGMGPMGSLNTFAGKLFAGFYALFSGLLFIVLVGVILAPIIHRFLHKFNFNN